MAAAKKMGKMRNKVNASTHLRIGASTTRQWKQPVVDDLFDNCRECSTNRPYFFQNKANLPAAQNGAKPSCKKGLRRKIRPASMAEQSQTNPISMLKCEKHIFRCGEIRQPGQARRTCEPGREYSTPRAAGGFAGGGAVLGREKGRCRLIFSLKPGTWPIQSAIKSSESPC